MHRTSPPRRGAADQKSSRHRRAVIGQEAEAMQVEEEQQQQHQHAASRRPKRRKIIQSTRSTLLCALLVGSAPAAMAQSCIPLSGSTQCSSFNASSISTDSALVGLFPFLSRVTNTASFDSGLTTYIANGFTQLRYQTLIGCSNVNLSNTTDFYARYTASVICNAIVQNSVTPCGLTGVATRPLCAESCASYAQSEQEISSSNVCGTTGSNAQNQIRADFTNCALPATSLSGGCISGFQNEPDNCGYSSNLGALCSYCAASSPNSTDSCCVFSNTETRCTGVSLPIVASSASLITFTATATASPTSSASSTGAAYRIGSTNRGLSGGQIAGIVIGALLGALVLLGLLIFGCLLLRRRSNRSPAASVFNQTASSRQVDGSAMSHINDGVHERAGLAVLPGGRVARMAALEGGSSSSERNGASGVASDYGRKSTSDTDETDIPDSRNIMSLAPPPERSGSLSSGSQLGRGLTAPGDDTSPSSGNEGMYSSPEGTGQSEQLGFFKDYYSQDEIHQNDLVSTLWAYEPRAADEFALERGDMVKVAGIWDDGWATGVRVRQKADDWREDGKVLRDSGMSNGSSNPPDSPESDGEVKAFPLVCVCLPQHWRKTIEGDSTEGTGSRGFPSSP